MTRNYNKKGMKTMKSEKELAAKIDRFDSFCWEVPKDIELSFSKFGTFYKNNYLKWFPKDKSAKILVVSCGPGYMLELLRYEGYSDVLGIDSSAAKIEHAKKRNLNCKIARALTFLEQSKISYEVIFCEQEINHMSKNEILDFLALCHGALREGGTLILHSLNGANPIVGVDNLALHFDHYNLFTEKSLGSVLKYSKFNNIKIFPLRLYVFYKNPLNYIGLCLDSILNLLFRVFFMFYGKSNKIFSKKIAAACKK